MEHGFWHERWRTGQIGFHLEKPNPQLVAHWDRVSTGPHRVLVPLCGKTVDLDWLAGRGHEVVGVELSELAARAFFSERGIVPEETSAGPLRALRHGAVTIAVGDFFEASAASLGGPFPLAYDRAAMIALPPELRTRYVPKLASLLTDDAALLLVTLDLDDTAGPPFAVDEAEVRRAYAAAEVERIDRVDVLADSPNLAARGVTRAHELVFRIRHHR